LNQAWNKDKKLNKLNWKLVKEIREMYKKGNVSQIQLAKEYDFSRGTINNLLLNKTWKEENE